MSEPLLTKQQVKETMNFAEAVWAAERYGYNVYSPWLSNQQLINLNNNPRPIESNDLRKALSTYKESSQNLQGYMDFMQHFDILFARTVQSYVNVLAFDLQVICQDDDVDYQSPEYIEDKRRIYQFLTEFDYKAEFRKVTQNVMLREADFVWFRKTKWGNKGMKMTLQEMPQDRCLLTGYGEKGMLLYDFDMNYFLQPGVDINGFDPVFKKYYNNVFGESQEYMNYNPTAPLNDRMGTYAMWTQTSPDDGSWCFKLNPGNFSLAPYLAPYMKEILRNDEIEALQYDKDFASAYGILAGEIRLFDNAKAGTVANQFAIDPTVLGTFMGKAKQGLGNSVKVAALPTENIKFFQFNDANSDMYSNQVKTTAGLGTGVSRVIYSSDRMSNAELQYAAEDIYHTMQPLYYQFGNFLEFFANKLTKKYKFSFIFEGNAYQFDREKRFDRLMKAADKGIVFNPTAYASALGMRPQDFERSLAEGHNGGWLNNLSLLLNANTTKDGGSTGGRDRKDDSELTDSGEESRETLE